MVNLRDNTISLHVHSYMHKFKSCPFAPSLVSELYVLSLFCVCAVGTDLNLDDTISSGKTATKGRGKWKGITLRIVYLLMWITVI